MDKEEKGLYRRLLEQGTSQNEIENVYKKLRERGYGEEAARKRVEAEVRRIRERNHQAQSRGGRTKREREQSIGQSLPEGAEGDDRDIPGAPAGSSTENAPRHESRRAEHWFPGISPALRRKINRWAFSHKLQIVGMRERIADFVSIFRPSTKDFVNDRLVRSLTLDRNFRKENPYEFTLTETLHAARYAAEVLLGRAANRNGDEQPIVDALRRRDPFALEYLTLFALSRQNLRATLSYMDASLAAGRRLEVRALGRVARDVWRLTLKTEKVSPRKVSQILETATDVVLAYGATAGSALEEATDLFRVCIDRFARFKRELYPVVLKATNCFYEESDQSPEKMERMYEFAGISPDDILTVRSYYERETRRKEQLLLEQQRKEIEILEQEKNDDFGRQFAGILGILGVLFPESGIENLPKRPYLLPYFDTRVFNRTSQFPHELFDVECIAAEDPMQPLLVLHRIIDDLSQSVDRINLEKVLGKDGIAERFSTLGEAWAAAYTHIFDPYVRAVDNFRRGISDQEYRSAFPNSPMARSLTEEINQYRNCAFKNWGHVILGAERYNCSRLYERTAEFHELLQEVGEDINQELVKRDDPLGKRMCREMGIQPFVDFTRDTLPTSPEFRPVTRQVKRYVEAKFYSSVSAIPRLSQVFVIDLLRGVVDLYNYLLSDQECFLRAVGDSVPIAGKEEQLVWQKERNERSRDSLELLRIRLEEQNAAEMIDGLTGLRNKNFYLKELPRHLEQLNKKKRPVCMLMADIDHFKWVNDDLGHQKGDDVLRDAATTIMDGFRAGHDIAVRYGGEEVLVVVQAPLHTALVLAERLRHAQQTKVEGNETYAPLREISERREGPCGTFSIGVAECGAAGSVDVGVELADKALYEAKQQRNAVVLVRGDASGTLKFTSYADYAGTVKRSG